MRQLRQLVLAISFLTRLPVPSIGSAEHELGASTWAFPLAGLLVGGISGLVYRGAAFLVWAGAGSKGTPGEIAPVLGASLLGAALSLAANALVTGGLHLDGLADVADGLAGGRNAEESLEIMRDSRIGSMGALWLTIDLLARYALLVVSGQERALKWLVISAATGRLAQVFAIVAFPYVRPTGLGKAFKDAARPVHLLVATMVTITAAVWVGTRGIVAAATGVLAGMVIAVCLRRRLGGLTGDAYGAINEMVEIVVLFGGALR